jgi:Predicted esterase of the alpha-beta hydrolase superfamily
MNFILKLYQYLFFVLIPPFVASFSVHSSSSQLYTTSATRSTRTTRKSSSHHDRISSGSLFNTNAIETNPTDGNHDNNNNKLNNNATRNNILDQKNKRLNLIFPGGGIFFYWQAGVITYLREKEYPLVDNPTIQFTGASAGALCATLTANRVDFEVATSLALEKCREAHVWDRPLGLYGIWGGIIDEWLHELLLDNSDESVLANVNDKISILVTEVPSFKKKKVSQFESRMDLIKANMASVHIPLFLDGKFTRNFRDVPHIDGSFLTDLGDYHKNDYSLVLDWKEDPFLSDRTLGDAVKALNEQGIWDLLEKGRKHAQVMESNGKFEMFFKMM